MLFLKLGNVRWASLFPRDPRSFLVRGQDPTEAAMAAANSLILHGPESTTFQPGKRHGEMPPLENVRTSCPLALLHHAHRVSNSSLPSTATRPTRVGQTQRGPSGATGRRLRPLATFRRTGSQSSSATLCAPRSRSHASSRRSSRTCTKKV